MDLDDNLARLFAVPVPDLSAIDGAALAARAQAEARRSRGALSAALVCALAIGVLGGMQGETGEGTPLVAFGPAPSLTPLIVLGQP